MGKRAVVDMFSNTPPAVKELRARVAVQEESIRYLRLQITDLQTQIAAWRQRYDIVDAERGRLVIESAERLAMIHGWVDSVTYICAELGIEWASDKRFQDVVVNEFKRLKGLQNRGKARIANET